MLTTMIIIYCKQKTEREKKLIGTIHCEKNYDKCVIMTSDEAW